MQPVYVTVTSSGSSPWKLTNWHVTPINLGFGVRTNGLTSNWQVDITMDDPISTYQSSAGPTIFSSLVSGSTNAIASITFPIAAWRVTNTSTAGTVTVTVLQSGIG